MNVLLVKMSSLGDVVHALPAVTDAVRHGVTIDWVVEEAFADLARMHPGVDRVIPVAWRRWRKSLLACRHEFTAFRARLAERRYDLILDSQGLFKSAAVGLLARGAKRAGFAYHSAREPLATLGYHSRCVVARGQHALDRQRQLFAAALGYEVDTVADAGLERGPVSEGQAFLLHGTTWPTKHWPQAMWIELAHTARRAGFEPTITWGNEAERTRAEAIAAATGATVFPRASLAQLTAKIGASEVVIGVDSGLTHLSAALGVPTLGLYGPTDAVLTGCRGLRANSLQAQLPCSPCLGQTCERYSGAALVWRDEIVEPPCFASLTPERVWAQAYELTGRPR